MTKPSGKPTYADIEALPSHLRGEILAGELVVLPRPHPRHALAVTGLTGQLHGPFGWGRGGPGGWWILAEPELSLGVDADFDPVVPDLAGWRRTRLPQIPEEARLTVAPDWVCEVLSPRTARNDRILKLPFYGRAGIGHAWLVDPSARTVEVFERDGATWRLAGVSSRAQVVGLAPFADVPLRLEELWGGPPAQPTEQH